MALFRELMVAFSMGGPNIVVDDGGAGKVDVLFDALVVVSGDAFLPFGAFLSTFFALAFPSVAAACLFIF
jgi:hypothetical protein